jgi:hypothetical protein
VLPGEKDLAWLFPGYKTLVSWSTSVDRFTGVRRGSKKYDARAKHWAYGTIGLITGFG